VAVLIVSDRHLAPQISSGWPDLTAQNSSVSAAAYAVLAAFRSQGWQKYTFT
jgi:hypothetical protein